MDNPRLFLWIGLALLAWMNVIQWNRDYGAGPAVATAPAASNSAATPAGNAPQGQLPSVPNAPAAAATTPGAEGAAAAAPVVAGNAPRVRVLTDVLDLDISLQGGDLVRADLVKYPRDKR